MKKYSTGCVHGRFQPLHKGHLEYMTRAQKQCDLLFVGITQCEDNLLLDSPEAPHRQEAKNNPMTYSERVGMIQQVLLDEGIATSEFRIIPFPIETPDHLSKFLPTTVPIFTTIYDDWNRHKIELLRERGYKVIVLWDRDYKQYDGMIIRKLICEDDDRWKEQVPPATAKVIEQIDLRERLLRLNRS